MVKKSKKLLHRTHKHVKKKAKFLVRHPFLLPVTVFFAVFFIGLIMFVGLGAKTIGAEDARIVNLYVDDEKQTLTTRAKTVEDLLNRLEVELIPEDIVEPARDTPILEDNTQVNVYRARPVEIIEGDRTITVLSAQQAPRLLAAEAGISLRPEDDVRFERQETNVLVSSASEQLIISRSIDIQFNLFGSITQQRTTSPTVQDVLDENGINVGEGETVQPALETRVTSGMLVSVNKPGISTLAVTEPIPFGYESREDASITVGQSQLLNAGSNGERAVIYEITEENGQETSRRELQTITLLEPVTEVRLVGTKPAVLSSSVNVSADKIALMAAAGIAESDYPYVDFIIAHESGWRPGAVNSSSGAYGLCQSLPASKMASAGADYLTNPVTQLRWCSGYAAGRYGGWQNAYNAWLVQRWW